MGASMAASIRLGGGVKGAGPRPSVKVGALVVLVARNAVRKAAADRAAADGARAPRVAAAGAVLVVVAAVAALDALLLAAADDARRL